MPASHRLVPLLLLCSSCVAGGPGLEPDQTSGVESAAAQKALAALRTRHRVKVRRDSEEHGPALPDSDAIIERAGERWLRQVESSSALEVAFPDDSRGRLRLRAQDSGIAVEAALIGARPSSAETADGYVVYRGGGPEASTLLHRPTEQGAEDYLAFDHRPASESVAYDVSVSPEVAGLRLVGNTLEFLDRTGDPKLRVAPPYLVDADGRQVAANLLVDGCDVDTDPAPPWDRAPTPPGAARCTVRVDWQGMGVRYPALLDPAWSDTANMISARYLFPTVKLLDGKVLVSGGYGTTHVAIRYAEYYNPGTRSWAAASDLPEARAEHTATVLSDGRVLVAGGFNASAVATSTSWLFSSAGIYSSSAGTMRSARAKHTATLILGDSRVLVAGGKDQNGTALSSAELYTPGSGWSTTGAMLAAQVDHRAIPVGNREVLVVGENNPSAQRYSLASRTWRATTPLAVPRAAGALTHLIDGRVMYAGGAITGSGFSGVVEIYRVSDETWERTGSLWHPHAHGTATLASNGRIFVIGGHLGDVTANSSVEIFNPTWGTWAPGPSMATARAGHGAVALASGDILVAGGSPFVFAAPTNKTSLLNTSIAAVTSSEYRHPAAIDPVVLPNKPTEVWARVYRPSVMPAGRRYPLVLLLHGWHNVCSGGASYVAGGECPAGQTVIKNHEGYAYIAEELASRDYIVVSINANRINDANDGGPIGDSYLIGARGRLVLRHLQELSLYNRNVVPTPASLGFSLAGRLDFSQIGLMGHSRGGEAMRSVYNQYRAGSTWRTAIYDPVTIRGIIELGGTNTTDPPLDADGTKWVAVLPMCDGDVAMDSMEIFDRMMDPFLPEGRFFKASYTIWGARHNAFNTVWGPEYLHECIGPGNRPIFGHSNNAEQLQSGLQPMLAFFLGNVGSATPSFNNWFDPRFPAVASPTIDRGYTPSANSASSRALEEFWYPTGTSSWGIANTSAGAVVEHKNIPHHPGQRGARIYWWGASQSSFFQTNFGQNVDLSGFTYLDLRLARTDLDPNDDVIGSWLNPVEPTNFEVRLVKSDGSLSGPVEIANHVKLDGPVGATINAIFAISWQVRPLLETARIPLSAFSGATLSGVRGVRLTFSKTGSGDIHVGSIRATVP